MEWARVHSFVLFTHDLDFGTILAITHSDGPSVIQMRTHKVLPASSEDILIHLLHRFESQLEQGSLIVVDDAKARIRVLPLRK